ncbi:MAG: hypothetical protein JW843_01210 [Candidatus Aminicenantes bacterium]|nr:hypothetical protein [Candidatus Aminicenantes bacterium]
MQEPDIREEINIIRTMVEKSRKSTIEAGGLFVFWGALIIAAMAATIVLENMKLFRKMSIPWTAALIIGWAVTTAYWIRRSRNRKVETYTGRAARYLGFSCGLGFFLGCYLFPLLAVYPHEKIPVVFSLIAGILFFISGGLYEWALLRWAGLVWWLGSIGLALLPRHVVNAAFLGLFVIGFFIPSLLIWRKHRSDQGGQ